MATVVTSQLSTVDSCESTTPGWTSFGTVASLASITASSEEQAPFAGTYCYAFDADIENGGHYATFTSTDYSSKIAYIAFCCWTASTLEVLSPGSGQAGVYIVGVDSSGNRGYWHVAGSDTYKGGWRVFVADLSRSPDTNSGTAPNMAQCTGLGIGVNHLAKCKATHNCFVDLVRVADSGQGLKVTTTLSTVADLDAIVTGDGTELLRKDAGIFYAKAPLIFGDTTSGDVEFSDAGQVLVFENLDVPSGHYGITVEGNSSGTIEFQTGTKSGTRGINGLTIIGNDPFHFTATDTDIDALKLYGTTFNNAAPSYLPPTATGREVVDCSFIDSGELDVDTCVVKYCSFVGADAGTNADGAVLISSASHAVSDCSFINCPDGIHIDTATTYNLTNCLFSGCTYDIGNDSGGAVIINALGTSNPSTSENFTTSTTSINNTKTVSVVAQEADGTKVSGARVLLEADTGGDLPSGASVSITSSGTTATVSHTAHAIPDGEQVVIRGADQKEYNGIHTITVTGVNAYTYTISGTPASPATGTITSTAVILTGETAVTTGLLTRTDFNYTNDQPVTGVIRKGTSSTYYKASPITGTLDSNGFSSTVVMTPDE